MIATNEQTAPVIMALDMGEVSKLIKAIKETPTEFWEHFSAIKVQQLKTDLNIFDVQITPQKNKSGMEILRYILTITKD